MERIRPQWHALYQHQLQNGMLHRLPEGAYDAWLKSITPFLGRFANVVVAELNGEIIAFVAGRLHTLRPYFGSSTIGTINEVSVSDAARALAGAFLHSHWSGSKRSGSSASSCRWWPRIRWIRFYRQLG